MLSQRAMESFLTDFTESENEERGTGVWKRVYSGNPHEKSKWRKKAKKKDWGLLFNHALFELDCRRKYHGQ